MENKIILGIQVRKSQGTGTDLQSIFVKYGGIIKTRLGLNEVVDERATEESIILLELSGDLSECQRLENELLIHDNLIVKKMIFPAKGI
ncbi:MAG: hypothetical protein AB9842_09455 [Bacteroidales bacterium]